MRKLGQGPRVVVEWWAPRALAASMPSASGVSTRRGFAKTTGDGLWVCESCLGPVAAGAWILDGEVPPRSANLGPRGVSSTRWVPTCEGVSAPGMRAGGVGAQLRDPVPWPPAVGVQLGVHALS
ncbi:unnamed protein product [Rangifer tarandus platyrhynchus]|uniref:Uncharacterized protein n=2 Tax=Rangifer tarandus platyrhynchus TaxID=3082113 RepID=A0ACB0E4M4_RANTA|nr:unnamed protein product [Rangifer tarandus platyrhynchus]CAI9695535.1 unnamed protein product [Rangifer tarandus platyrhynchus]